jgi:hypothetical protein
LEVYACPLILFIMAYDAYPVQLSRGIPTPIRSEFSQDISVSNVMTASSFVPWGSVETFVTTSISVSSTRVTGLDLSTNFGPTPTVTVTVGYPEADSLTPDFDFLSPLMIDKYMNETEPETQKKWKSEVNKSWREHVWKWIILIAVLLAIAIFLFFCCKPYVYVPPHLFLSRLLTSPTRMLRKLRARKGNGAILDLDKTPKIKPVKTIKVKEPKPPKIKPVKEPKPSKVKVKKMAKDIEAAPDAKVPAPAAKNATGTVGPVPPPTETTKTVVTETPVPPPAGAGPPPPSPAKA